MNQLEELFTTKLKIDADKTTPISPITKSITKPQETTSTLSYDTFDIPDEYIGRLKTQFSNSKLNINHEEEILKQTTFKNANIYCVINNISSQKYGPMLEKYIKIKYNFIKNNASECTGDISKENKNCEVKVSLGGQNHNKFNWVQLRISHNIQYYILTAYYITSENCTNGGNLFIFKVPKDDIILLILKYGGYAHKTTRELGKITIESLQDNKNNNEYAIRPSYGSTCWNQFLKFRIKEEDL